MNILIITPRLCYGGAERVSVLLANSLAERGHYVTILSNLFEPISYELNRKVVIVNMVTTNSNKLIKWLSGIGTTRRVLKEIRPDVIIGVMSTCSLIAKIAGWKLNIPIVATEHDAFERPSSAPFTYYTWFCKFVLNKLYKYITVLTTPDKEVIRNRFRNVYVMPNPLSFRPVKVFPSKEKVILAVGRLEDWHYKGFDILIKSWGKIASKYPDWKLFIAGKGNQKQERFLLKMIDELGLKQQARLIGFHEDIEKMLKTTSIFVLSSRYEGFGLVLIEAMSQGCACIAADYKGRQREIFGSANAGIVIEPDNIEAMSGAIETLIINEHKRESLSKNAIERSKYYQTTNIASLWEKLLELIKHTQKS